MSGFRGGFGSSQPPQQPAFGSQQNPAQPQFGSGFGSSQPGFGATPAAAQSFGDGGFSPAASSPFGGSAATPAPSFGTSSTAAPFGASGNVFEQAPSTFGVQSGGFGPTTTATPSSFGGSSSNQTFPVAPPSQSSGGPSVAPQFGGASAAQPFGGGATPTTQPFGGAPAASSQTTAFMQADSSPFQQTGPPASAGASPFGNANTTNPAILSFGVSSNVVQSSNTSGFSSSAMTGSLSPMTTSFPPSFDTSSSAPAFRSAAVNVDMGDSSDFNTMTSSAQPQSESSQQSSWPGQNDWKGRHHDSAMSPLPEQGVSMVGSSMLPRQGAFSPPVPDAPSTSKAPESEEAKLVRLKARIQAKKKKLEEQKKRKEAAVAAAAALRTTPTPESAELNPDAAPFTPTEILNLAERNKLRFAAPKVKSSQLSEGLKEKVEDKTEAEDEAGRGREDLENAVSLVGTCQYMCPDDELLRREREGDIQLLEIPQPGSIHPVDWTLRETAVKRFRRSAADFKLNVPEWVRPPAVLEKVCGYLEEWVMERDRQGLDPRFTQVESPPPLDVYQFIWDRTRMIRKDFTLQNYVGTGGNCDASAVRCHERIARWHAMCEHQLSHIPEFASRQSQQNIQELGQTMKTLNQFYDDSLGRSTVEVFMEGGKAVKSSNTGSHGCQSDVVMGKCPVDFDGSPLENKTADPNRLIGANAVDKPSHGTAEPEMRGLYILLTMNNDGGLEVLKYAGRLFRERPDVYNSKPVQLALQVYKAKQDYNYARFFSILRSPSTPYLFACIMFVHVQQMRKIAFRIMSKTFGARRKETGEALYDLYPLNHLVHLLCFEDQDDALEVCKHYNITVRKMESSSGKSVHVISWRHSEFRESKDPVKGTVVPIKPRKMIRTIEAKLQGATRLAVCRGDVSGEGASLSASTGVSHAADNRHSTLLTKEELERQTREAEEVRAATLKAEGELEKRRQEEKARRKVEQERKRKEEEQRKEAERKRQEELAKKQAEEALRREIIRKKEREVELARKKAAEEERKKREAEEARMAELAAAEERRRQQKVEAERLAAEQEAARKKAEEELREQQRLLQYAEAQRLLKLQQQEEERKRREEESRRLRQLEIQRQREEEERRRRKERERKIALEWERKINAARKLVFWRRWRRKVERRLVAERAQESLSQIDATYSLFSPVARRFVEQAFTDNQYVETDAVDVSFGVRERFHRLRLGRRNPFNLTALLRESFEKRVDGWHGLEKERRIEHLTVLCKLAIVLPKCFGVEDTKFYELIHEWIDSRLQYGKVVTDLSAGGDFARLVELRTVAVNGNIDAACEACDVALFIIPPRPDSKNFNGNISFDADTTLSIGDSTPKLLINLDDQSDAAYNVSVSHILSEVVGDTSCDKGIISLEETGDFMTRIDTALESSCRVLFEAFWDVYPEYSPRLDPVTLPGLARRCICDALWTTGYSARTEAGSHILGIARAAMMSLVTELNSLATSIQNSRLSVWPPKEFADKLGLTVKGYFGSDSDLPLAWNNFILQDAVEPILLELCASLNGSFRYAIDNMLCRAPLSVRNESDDMIDKKQFRRCLEKALLWQETNKVSNRLSRDESYVYLPKGEVKNISEAVIRRLQLNDDVEGCKDHSSLRTSLGSTRQLGRNAFNMVATMSDEAFVEETPALQSPKSDSKASIKDASEYFGVEIMDDLPLERGIGDFNARSTQDVVKLCFEDEDRHFSKSSKRSMDSASQNRSANVHHNKRQRRRESAPTFVSKDEQDSHDFTHRLESLLHGEATIDVDIGNAKLSDLLSGDVPQIDLP